ncbi:hypothetical protein FPZ24_02955 [Sphingomonas panacisoli]|uniref:Uncharacterized protein n=1 Tax=Sphingomonas panacisoli TaxID=1813879 RepID=A0A5B8LFB9_9SPHN|nr:hypothetical protein [Sphingomonas panacisoli]QDZ06559.1 hypothetical protein FPZ24_02955 [Sphingomonas panacisoli]
MSGTETSEYLGGIIADAFKREVDADDAVWRSLPFFAAIIGLAIAVLPAVYRTAWEISDRPWWIAAMVVFAIAILCFTISGYWFWIVIRPREYIYPPPPDQVLTYAEELAEYYRSRRMSDERRDLAVRNDLRDFMLRQLAEATANNRRNNNAKALARSQVLIFVMAGFLLAFLCEGTTLIAGAFS